MTELSGGRKVTDRISQGAALNQALISRMNRVGSIEKAKELLTGELNLTIERLARASTKGDEELRAAQEALQVEVRNVSPGIHEISFGPRSKRYVSEVLEAGRAAGRMDAMTLLTEVARQLDLAPDLKLQFADRGAAGDFVLRVRD